MRDGLSSDPNTKSGGQPAAQDPSRAFLERLMKSVRLGHRLDDPRNVEVLQRWAIICKGLPDNALMQVIPQTLRALLRQDSTSERLIACGISLHHPLQHEAIAPYVISYRRYMAARGHDPKDEQARRTIDALRAELRALHDQFNMVFDQVAGLEQERERLAIDNDSLQQQVLAERVRGEDALRRLAEARDNAQRLFRLYLYMLKEERSRLSNDPRRERLLTAEIAVETHAATLEALGARSEVEDTALGILGEDLFAEYFHGPENPARLPPDMAPEPDVAPEPEANAKAGEEPRPSNIHVLRRTP
ncbi:MAG: hypothetical protein WCZ23_07815 [Rhodospirillaceae bacterium]